MKILLTTLNATYMHTALSLRYLYSYCKKTFPNIVVQEYTINQHVNYILGEIYKGKYDIIGFSCYIWNISPILQLARNLKKINPHQIIILGGPEVSFDSVELMEAHPYIDYIVFGEGEETFKELLNCLINKNTELAHIKGITYRDKEGVRQNEARELIQNLDTIPSPFEEGIQQDERKIIYYESSRGCPYRCSYCISSTIKGVRFFSLERVKKDLSIFLEKRVRQVKFVDRTFNANKEHSLAIMKYLAEKDNGYTNFHFEMTGDRIDEEMLEFLSGVREGLFQFEIGVQTTYDKCAASIHRHVDFHKLSHAVKTISGFKNIHLHLDLIAGLPHEGFERFKKSFDDVYRLKPQQLQLGFLKLLKGSQMRDEKDKYGYIFQDEPPYEVLGNDAICYEELLKLKGIEDMLEKYYNSGDFQNALGYILMRFYKSPFEFYHDLAEFWEANGYHHISHNRDALYKHLLDFYLQKNFTGRDIFEEILKLDYLMHKKGAVPEFFPRVEMDDFQNRVHRFLQDKKNVEKYLPQYIEWPAKQIIKRVHFECFRYDVLEIIKHSDFKQTDEKINVVLFDYDVEQKIFYKSKCYKVEI